MRPDRRRLIKAGFLVLSLGAAQLARGANMLAVRIWPAPDYSRVTLESDAPIQSTQTFIASPPRLAVDIEGMQLNAALRELVGKVQASDPNIAGIRVGSTARMWCVWSLTSNTLFRHRSSACNPWPRMHTAWCWTSTPARPLTRWSN